ncbi:hypothetical protein PR048_010130 [Dryococelus australis]|uniref:Uncharacterized protein n=1 Tax=Dryococelus australis TaxID=614101 RepID=A0ABQ9I1V9_9NEOP|nr:hypothetical protein PR048_010130 [Dryococelus australis]
MLFYFYTIQRQTWGSEKVKKAESVFLAGVCSQPRRSEYVSRPQGVNLKLFDTWGDRPLPFGITNSNFGRRESNQWNRQHLTDHYRSSKTNETRMATDQSAIIQHLCCSAETKQIQLLLPISICNETIEKLQTDTVNGKHLSDAKKLESYLFVGAMVAEQLACSPPTKAIWVTPDFCMWELCQTMPLVGGFTLGSLVSPYLSFRHCSILTSITLIGSQNLSMLRAVQISCHFWDTLCKSGLTLQGSAWSLFPNAEFSWFRCNPPAPCLKGRRRDWSREREGIFPGREDRLRTDIRRQSLEK